MTHTPPFPGRKLHHAQQSFSLLLENVLHQLKRRSKTLPRTRRFFNKGNKTPKLGTHLLQVEYSTNRQQGEKVCFTAFAMLTHLLIHGARLSSRRC